MFCFQFFQFFTCHISMGLNQMLIQRFELGKQSRTFQTFHALFVDSSSMAESISINDLRVIEDIRQCVPEDDAPRRRIGPHAKGVQLLEAAQNCQHSWNRAVATAVWRAEELRAARRPFDMAVASAGFQADPFKWEAAEAWRHQRSRASADFASAGASEARRSSRRVPR